MRALADSQVIVTPLQNAVRHHDLSSSQVTETICTEISQKLLGSVVFCTDSEARFYVPIHVHFYVLMMIVTVQICFFFEEKSCNTTYLLERYYRRKMTRQNFKLHGRIDNATKIYSEVYIDNILPPNLRR